MSSSGSGNKNEPVDLFQLVRENERMKSALLAIRSYAEQAIIGGWRQQIVNLTTQGLRK